jgi:hypothetical protein
LQRQFTAATTLGHNPFSGGGETRVLTAGQHKHLGSEAARMFAGFAAALKGLESGLVLN